MAKFIVVHSVKVATEFVPETFGRLTTIGPRFMIRLRSGATDARQVCQCACGNFVVSRVAALYQGRILSCTCLRRETTERNSFRHGATNSKEYNIWAQMLSRCNNTNCKFYKDYGGRGIRVCARWQEPNGQGFINFFSDMGTKPVACSIDRTDNDGDYCPENCRWATSKEQTRNRRGNRKITFEGKTQCVVDWAKDLGINEWTLRARLRLGWPIERAFTEAVH
jgi:hypothetical protein